MSARLRCGLCCHGVTPDHRGIRPPWDRNCGLMTFAHKTVHFESEFSGKKTRENAA